MFTEEAPTKELPSPHETLHKKNENQIPYYLGYGLLAISAAVYLITELFGLRRSDDGLTLFVAHYALALAFTFILLHHKKIGIRKSWYRTNIHLTIILLNLFLVSAYSLNRVMDVFQDSSDWLCVAILITSTTALAFRFYPQLPSFVKGIGKAILGFAIVLYTYMIFYVAPFYAFGAIGTILLAVGFHIFVPLLMVTSLIALLYKIHHDHDRSVYWAIIGGSLTTIYTIFFALEWRNRIQRIEHYSYNSVLDDNTELPHWITIAENIEDDWITRTILKGTLRYTLYNPNQWHFIPNRLAWDEKRIHDPLVFIGSLFGEVNLTEEDRIKILHTISERRHKSEERLWSGDNLVTAHIINDIDIYPDLRFAYTENYFDIKNTSEHGRWWGNTQEALYTFQLPEGSVVTSLSLWIEGKEQKGILTSKGKATEAYNTIVGKEVRDPSVVHWREGNTVVVRVFPCTTEEERKVKIGITTPLQVQNGALIYSNIMFDGPSPNEAQQTIRIRFPKGNAGIQLPNTFERDNKGYFTAKQSYDEKFTLKLPLTTIPKNNQFSFDGFTYQIADHQPTTTHLDVKSLYLDLNNSWTSDELSAIQNTLDYAHAIAYTEGEFINITQANWSQIVPILAKRNFSIFPFHKIKDVDHALVVTKGNPLSIQLSDLKDTPFSDALHTYFSDEKRIFTFNLTGGTSTYIRSLRELRVLHYASGDTEYLNKLIKSKTFPTANESENRVVLHDANVAITKTVSDPTPNINTAPDHLARLFSYNDIMRQTGYHHFQKEYTNDNLVTEAAKAYVVSPLSSLIVLETQADYDRFGIKDVNNTLGNASKQSTGAVPEPHEWIMIILCGIIILYFKFKQ
ncbi:XrtN system VIT domain-containing protein [Pseudochryseolinea flava]|uniref:XrtN system VIT domain-containing protein n=1 Tax=Pseudochryseolinea flava TaxID=2059302 RepID=A0A364Y253_9BACT|nr:XrtN system VIT domain-containing protein [Pseudochryseolinea flava]RAW00353.1 XrtN system VIT domain-containing protein [Pseudochryseolinea flava]